jgi:hypothetical protein
MQEILFAGKNPTNKFSTTIDILKRESENDVTKRESKCDVIPLI